MATQWWRIKAAYLKGDMSLTQLAKKYHVGVSTIKKHASNEGWVRERDQIETEASQAIHARAIASKQQQLESLITANERMAKALMDLTKEIEDDPKILLGAKKDGKAADSISKAIMTTIQNQRDLHKLPTLDQDMHRKEEAQRKREAKAKMDLDREKWALAKEEKQRTDGTAGVKWQILMPAELLEQGGELDG